MSSISPTVDFDNCNHGLPLVVMFGHERTEIFPGQLSDDGFRANQFHQCANAHEPPIFIISCLSSWSDADRWSALLLIASLGNARVKVQETGTDTTGLFDAAVSMIVGSADPQQCARSKQAAIQTAALTCPQAESPAASRIADRLHEVGVRGERADRIAREIRELGRSLRVANERGPLIAVRVQDYLPDAPVGETAIVPSGWRVDGSGVTREAGNGQPALVCPTPLVITRRLGNIDDDTEASEIAFIRDGRWKFIIVARTIVSTASGIVELADRGVPVTSNTAADLVRYIADFEATNIEVLPRARVTGHLGWAGDVTTDGFLLGATLITSGAAPGSQEIAFSGGDADGGADQVAAGFHSAGTLQGWQQAVAPLAQCPRAQMGVYAALATPLLRLLGAKNFALSYAGATSTGKTTVLKCAASVWGCPDEQSPASVVGTWDATPVALERSASVQADLPLIVDDSKRAKFKDNVAQFLYHVATGRGRSRGSITGLRRTRTWHTIMITSGEDPITSFGEHGGTRARVLEISGSPFAAADATSGQVVTQLNLELMEHYGHAGLAWLQYIVDHSSEWPAWKRHYQRLCDRLQRRAGNDPVAGRLAKHLALIRTTAILAHLADILPWGYREVTQVLWPELMSEAPEADRAAAALRHVLSWAHSHANEFFGHHGPGDRGIPNQGWAGRWDVDEFGRGWQWLGLFPHKLRELLLAAGFNYETVLRLWHGRGWLRTDTDGRRLFRARLGDDMARLVAVERNAIEDLEGVGGEPDPGFDRMFAALMANGEHGNGLGTQLGTG